MLLRFTNILNILVFIHALNPAVPPGQNFDLSPWKIQLPVNCANGFTGSMCEINPVTSTYTNFPYFYTSLIDGAAVFYTPYNGLHTTNSVHPRTELRELVASVSKGDWNVTKYYTFFSATLAVNQLPTLNAGGYGTVVIGQIHQSSSGELWRLYYSAGGAIYWAMSPPSGLTNVMSVNGMYVYSSSKSKTAIPINSKFTYSMQTNITHMITKVIYNSITYSSIYRIPSYWQGSYATMYYKVGSYCQVNADSTSKFNGAGACQVSFYSIAPPVESTSPIPLIMTTLPSKRPTLSPSTQSPVSKRPSYNPTKRPVSSNPTKIPSYSPTKAPVTKSPVSSKPIYPTQIPTRPSLTPTKPSFSPLKPTSVPNPSTGTGSNKKGFAYPTANTWVTKVNPKWYYNWGVTMTPGVNNIPFVPMIWGKNSGVPVISVYLLGFNEPDSSSQSNLTPAMAASLWTSKVTSTSASQIGSPATAENPVTGSSQWLTTFLSQSPTPHVDFICLHRYGSADVNTFLSFVDNVWNTYKKPIWITEFAVADWSASTGSTLSTKYTVQQVIDFMKGAVAGLETRSYVHRYSWKTRTTTDPAMWFSAIFNSDGSLTTLGQVYASL